MKKKLWNLRLVLIPVIVLGVLFMAFPYFTFGIYPKTTIFVYLGVMIFLSLLRLKGNKTNKTLDQVLTILILMISVPVFIFVGIPAFIVAVIVRPLMYGIMYILGTTVLYVFGVKLNFIGKLPKGQFIVIYNHCSAIDDVINPIIMGLKRWKVVFAPEITRIPFVTLFLKFIGIPLNRSDQNSKEEIKGILREKVDKKYSILILPEGKRLPVDRKEDEYLLPFSKGAFFISQKTGIPIVCVIVSWTYLFKPRAGQWWFSPREIIIEYFNPISIEKDETIGSFGKRARLIMEEQLIKHINSQK